MTSRNKKIGLIAGGAAGFSAAAAMALRRRWSKSKPEPEAEPEVLSPRATAFLEHLGEAVRIATVSHEDPGSIDRTVFAEFRAFLERTYPAVHETLKRELVAGDSLLFTWEGSDPDAEPFLLLAHHDVVPVEAGTEEDWPQAPFSGAAADGFLWGRGALDDKGSLIAMLEAVESLIDEGYAPAATVYLASGHDEEVGGGSGAAAIANLLAERGVRLSFVLDEGGAVASGFIDGVDRALALIGIGEKGYLDVELSVSGAGGHASVPPPSTAVGAIASAVHALEANPMPARVEAQRPLLDALAGSAGPLARAMLKRPDTFGGLVAKKMSKSPLTDALIRTTMAATMISGGVKANVLPTEAGAIVNVRVLPGDTSSDALEHIRRVVGPAVRVRSLDTGFSPEPSTISSTESAAFGDLAGVVHDVFPGARVAPWVLTGATDSRHFAPIAQDVYRFLPFRITPEDFAGVHGVGERVRVDDADLAVSFYRRLIVRAATFD